MVGGWTAALVDLFGPFRLDITWQSAATYCDSHATAARRRHCDWSGDSSEREKLFLAKMSELDMTRSSLLLPSKLDPFHLSRKNTSKRTTSGPTRFRLCVLLFLLLSSVGGLPATATNPWTTTLCYKESHDATTKCPILVSQLHSHGGCTVLKPAVTTNNHILSCNMFFLPLSYYLLGSRIAIECRKQVNQSRNKWLGFIMPSIFLACIGPWLFTSLCRCGEG